MMKLAQYLKAAAMAFTGVLLLSVSARAEKEDDNEDLPLSQVPPAALAALQAHSATPIAKVELNDENGVLSYQIDVIVDGKKQELTVDAKGQIVATDNDDEEKDGKGEDDEKNAKAGRHGRGHREVRTAKAEKHARAPKEVKTARTDKQGKAQKEARSAKKAKAATVNPA